MTSTWQTYRSPSKLFPAPLKINSTITNSTTTTRRNPIELEDSPSPKKKRRVLNSKDNNKNNSSSRASSISPNKPSSSSTLSSIQSDHLAARLSDTLQLKSIWSDIFHRHETTTTLTRGASTSNQLISGRSRALREEEDDIIDLDTLEIVIDRGILRGSKPGSFAIGKYARRRMRGTEQGGLVLGEGEYAGESSDDNDDGYKYWEERDRGEEGEDEDVLGGWEGLEGPPSVTYKEHQLSSKAEMATLKRFLETEARNKGELSEGSGGFDEEEERELLLNSKGGRSRSNSAASRTREGSMFSIWIENKREIGNELLPKKMNLNEAEGSEDELAIQPVSPVIKQIEVIVTDDDDSDDEMLISPLPSHVKPRSLPRQSAQASSPRASPSNSPSNYPPLKSKTKVRSSPLRIQFVPSPSPSVSPFPEDTSTLKSAIFRSIPMESNTGAGSNSNSNFGLMTPPNSKDVQQKKNLSGDPVKSSGRNKGKGKELITNEEQDEIIIDTKEEEEEDDPMTIDRTLPKPRSKSVSFAKFPTSAPAALGTTFLNHNSSYSRGSPALRKPTSTSSLLRNSSPAPKIRARISTTPSQSSQSTSQAQRSSRSNSTQPQSSRLTKSSSLSRQQQQQQQRRASSTHPSNSSKSLIERTFSPLRIATEILEFPLAPLPRRSPSLAPRSYARNSNIQSSGGSISGGGAGGSGNTNRVLRSSTPASGTLIMLQPSGKGIKNIFSSPNSKTNSSPSSSTKNSWTLKPIPPHSPNILIRRSNSPARGTGGPPPRENSEEDEEDDDPLTLSPALKRIDQIIRDEGGESGGAREERRRKERKAEQVEMLRRKIEEEELSDDELVLK